MAVMLLPYVILVMGQPDKVLYMKAHSDLPYYEILTMMDLGRDAGARVLAAVSETTPEDEEL